MNTTIALTISPPNRISAHRHFKNPAESVYCDDKFFINIVFDKSRIRDYTIYPEFDAKGRLHYHGTLVLDNNQKCRFYKYTQAKLTQLGFVDFKILATDQDRKRWSEYITKEWEFTKGVLDVNIPIVFDDYKKQQKVIKEIQKNNTLLDYFPNTY